MTQKLQDEAKRLKREYLRVWRSKNRSKIKKYQENFWLRRAAESIEKEECEDDQD